MNQNPLDKQWKKDAAGELLTLVGGLTNNGYDSCADFCQALRDTAAVLEELHCGSEGKAIAKQVLGELTGWDYKTIKPVRLLKRKPTDDNDR